MNKAKLACIVKKSFEGVERFIEFPVVMCLIGLEIFTAGMSFVLMCQPINPCDPLDVWVNHNYFHSFILLNGLWSAIIVAGLTLWGICSGVGALREWANENCDC